MPNGDWSWIHYRELIENKDWGVSALLSLRIAFVGRVAATALSTAFALGFWMIQPRFAPLLVGFVVLPMIVHPVVSAMTLYFLLTKVSAISEYVGYDSWLGVVIAHVVMISPFAVVMILVSLSGVDRRIDLAARGLGASERERALQVILPNIKFGVLTAALLCFVLSWEEIGVTLFVTRVNAVTLPRLIWMGVHDNIDPAVAAISVAIIVVTAVTMTLRKALRRADA